MYSLYYIYRKMEWKILRMDGKHQCLLPCLWHTLPPYMLCRADILSWKLEGRTTYPVRRSTWKMEVYPSHEQIAKLELFSHTGVF